MANRTVRLYAFTAAILLFLVAWAAIAARPWITEATPTAALQSAQDTPLVTQQGRIERKAATLRDLLATQGNVPAASKALASQPAPAAQPVRIVQSAPVTQSKSS